ncbi:hypothetical protein [Vibrio sp. F74]|uniref:hypothetical protein n=1 Tax=Vibrio sp. F74 TaxID=700020 RepID=UPI0035F55AB9
MTKKDKLLSAFSSAVKAGGGIHTAPELAYMLSDTGDISQILMDRLTVVTKGRNGTFSTPYGVIEFTHTKKPIARVCHARKCI